MYNHLSKNQISEFYDRGFIKIPDLFSSEQINLLKNEFQKLYHKSTFLKSTCLRDGSQFVFTEQFLQRVVWCGANSQSLLKVGEDLRIITRVFDLFDNPICVEQLINQAHFKMPGDQVEFPWHQDSQHRGYGTKNWTDVNSKGSYVQTVLVIDKMTQDNGSLIFVPYSNHKGHLGLDRNNSYMHNLKENEFEFITANPGTLLMFGPYTVHGSKINNSISPRRVLINGYAYPGANHKDYPGEGSCRIIKNPNLSD